MQILEINNNIKNIKAFTFTDWFYKSQGIVLKGHELLTPESSYKSYYNTSEYTNIPFEKYILDDNGSHLSDDDADKKIFGLNYGVISLLSFSTPHIILSNGDFLGVGHINI